MQFNAAGAERDRPVAPRAPSSRVSSRQAPLLSESGTLLAGPPPLFEALSPRERELVLRRPDALLEMWGGVTLAA